MSAWVRFINKTKYEAIYLRLNEYQNPVMLIKNCASEYVFSNSGSISAEINDAHGHFLKSVQLSVIPAKKQTIVIK